MSDFPDDDLLAEIAELWAQITERDDAIAELRALAGEDYDAIIANACDGESTYSWDVGIAP